MDVQVIFFGICEFLRWFNLSLHFFLNEEILEMKHWRAIFEEEEETVKKYLKKNKKK